MFEIQIAKYIRTDKDGYNFLINLYWSVKEQEERQISLDFSSCLIFDANLSAVLGAIIDELRHKGYNFSFSNLSHNVLNTFNNGFSEAIHIKSEKAKIEKDTSVKYRFFSISEGTEFKQYIDDELISKQKFPKHTKLVGRSINLNIYEVFVNAITHGNSRAVYCCGEYLPDLQPPKLDMTIVDCGITIHKNVNSFLESTGKPVIRPDEAIRWAIEEGNTTKPTTGGLGLSLLINFLTLNKGSMHIVSSSGILSYENGITTVGTLDGEFPGTIVNMHFNFDDDNTYYMSGEKTDLNNLL